MKNFRTYQLALELYKETARLRLSAHLKTQLLRASSSIVANLAEGYGKTSPADQTRFYEIAFGSCKETQAFLDMGGFSHAPAGKLADQVGAHIYRLLGASRS